MQVKRTMSMNKHQSILINPRLFEILIQNQNENQEANLGQSSQ